MLATRSTGSSAASTAAARISLASASIERPWRAARRRSFSFTSGSRSRTVSMLIANHLLVTRLLLVHSMHAWRCERFRRHEKGVRDDEKVAPADVVHDHF